MAGALLRNCYSNPMFACYTVNIELEYGNPGLGPLDVGKAFLHKVFTVFLDERGQSPDFLFIIGHNACPAEGNGAFIDRAKFGREQLGGSNDGKASAGVGANVVEFRALESAMKVNRPIDHCKAKWHTVWTIIGCGGRKNAIFRTFQ